MTTQPAPAPGFRIERCGNLFVYVPLKPKGGVK
jgi:hypothetical protein